MSIDALLRDARSGRHPDGKTVRPQRQPGRVVRDPRFERAAPPRLGLRLARAGSGSTLLSAWRGSMRPLRGGAALSRGNLSRAVPSGQHQGRSQPPYALGQGMQVVQQEDPARPSVTRGCGATTCGNEAGPDPPCEAPYPAGAGPGETQRPAPRPAILSAVGG